MSASFKRTTDDEKVEGRLTINITPDLPMLMLIMLTLKLSLVRLQASDARVAFGISEPGAVEAEMERLEAVKAAGDVVLQNESMLMSPVSENERKSEATTAPLESSRSSSNASVHSGGKSWFQRKFKISKG
ncbi:hypothetical protein LPJ57_000991 [Coemansia sp. RSA 486]|nr:hypothetical protein LPJ57_000991 [Coemansia sp. RSA 486]KAJ2224509.1 hypothetical protein IWW45_008072 [Coemansia sp. RSA 485]KAJ2603402.1 hypothetical protein GGF39_000126 [Coemansia sp. RSA 1721]KAJ2638000.1 hypothetical protein GGF40_001961 [Coemansia sp. RSA 1286]